MISINYTRKADKDLIICRCEGVRLGQIQAAVRQGGIQTVNQVKKLKDKSDTLIAIDGLCFSVEV